jgi:ATP-dependent Lon protease
MEESETRSLPMMAIRETVVFPGAMTPFVVGRAASVRALTAALDGDKKLFLVAQRDGSADQPKADEIFEVGTVVNIVQSLKLPDGNVKVLVEGVERATLVSFSDEEGFFRATVRTSTYPAESGPRLDALIGRVVAWSRMQPEPANSWHATGLEDPGKLADTVGADPLRSFAEKQELLEIFDPVKRLARVAEILGSRHADVLISTAVLTRWVESCSAMNRLGTLLHEEIEGRNRSQRTHDLAERARRVARHLADELAAYGGKKP